MTSDDGSVGVSMEEDAFPMLSENQVSGVREYGSADTLIAGADPLQ